MPINRRTVLQGIALSSVAGFALDSVARDSTSGAVDRETSPLLALVNERDPVGTQFLRGIHASGVASIQVANIGDELQEMLDLERGFRSRRGARIVGLLDDATGTLVVDLARSAGARLHWLGQHTSQAMLSRHHFVHAHAAAPCLQWFARQMHLCEAPFHISDQSYGDSAIRYQWRELQSSSGVTVSWPVAIGYLLASFDRAPTLDAPATSQAGAVDGRFVSFLIET
jgi:hypothetical protein